MWISVSPKDVFGTEKVDLVLGAVEARRHSVEYEKTIRRIASVAPAVTGIVVPRSHSDDVRFDFVLFVLLLRLEPKGGLRDVPILVSFRDEDEFCKFPQNLRLTEEQFRRLGVSSLPPDKTIETVEIHRPDARVVESDMRSLVGTAQRRTGRHSQANRWSPFVFFRVMEAADPKFAEVRKKIEESMFDEPYLKQAASRFIAEDIGTAQRTEFVSKRHDFERFLESLRQQTVLIVEDQLDAGWRDVYTEVFRTASQAITLLWASTVDEAREKFSHECSLVVLDMRLDGQTWDKAEVEEDEPAGVLLARYFRDKCKAVPVLAATASNKTWTLEPLLEAGVNGYWVKDSPSEEANLNHSASNVQDLLQKIREILDWSMKTRPWIEGLYRIADEVSRSDAIRGLALKQKAASLHASLHRSFSPFSRALDKGLQNNLAFLILFSCANDLRAWCCDAPKDQTGECEWTLVEAFGPKREALIRKRENDVKKGGAVYVYELLGQDGRMTDFPDTESFIALLSVLGLSEAECKYKKLKKKRNVLPLIHGVTDAAGRNGRGVEDASDEEILTMLWVLQAVVLHRSELSSGDHV